MSFPQPKSSVSVLNSLDHFRLYTPLESSGDIYRIDTSIKGLCIGPLSDIQTVKVLYWDPQQPSHINEAAVSVSDPFTGRLDSYNDREYPGLGTKGVIRVRADDWVPNPDQQIFLDTDVPADGELVVWHRPYLDLIGYHTEPQSLPVARSERHWYEQVIIQTQEQSASSFYLYPHYRRKYFHGRILNMLGEAYEVNVYGMTLMPSVWIPGTPPVSWAPLPVFHHLVDSANLGVGLDVLDIALYSDKIADQSAAPAVPVVYSVGYYDYILVQITGTPFGYNDTYPGLGITMDIVSSDWA